MVKSVIVLFLTFLLLISCTDDVTNSVVENSAPNTFISLFPQDSITQQRSKLKVSWWGDDPDGLVVGYYFQWAELENEWHFTNKNDSIFSLPIGTTNQTFTFKIMSADNGGNGLYDNSIVRNDINLGPEPFYDVNNNGAYDNGEPFLDIGDTDPTPAELKFPIKNSAPEVEWNDETVLPLTSFPVMTVGWNADDLDGTESITKINLALNDTNQFVELEGGVRLVTLRIDKNNNAEPQMEILINGSESRIEEERLKNLLLDDNNRLYIQAIDVSGAKSSFIPLPDTSRNWYVKNPKGNVLILDDYENGETATQFYNDTFDRVLNGQLQNNYDVFDLESEALPYANITFLETIKLFNYLYWYSDSSPELSLANLSTQKYIQNGGKIIFSQTFEDSSANFDFGLQVLQNFLPVDGLGESTPTAFLFPGANVTPVNGNDYPELTTASTIGFVRTFVPNTISASKIYDLESNQISGNIAFMDNTKSLFFIGLPLHQCDGNAGSVIVLFDKIFQEFGYKK